MPFKKFLTVGDLCGFVCVIILLIFWIIYWYNDHNWAGGAATMEMPEKLARTFGQITNLILGLLLIPVIFYFFN